MTELAQTGVSSKQPPDLAYAVSDVADEAAVERQPVAPIRYAGKRGLNSEAQLSLVKRFCAALRASGESFFLSDQIERNLVAFLSAEDEKSSPPEARQGVKRVFRGCCEMLFDGETAYAVLRPGAGLKHIIRIHPEFSHVEDVARGEYLEIKDAFIQGHEEAGKHGLTIDFSPFFRGFPKVGEASEMGEGISVLNRYLSARLYQNPEAFRRAFLAFFRGRKVGGQDVLVNEHLDREQTLLEELAAVRSLLDDYNRDTPLQEFSHQLRAHGFEPGWGTTAGRVAENLALLARILDAPEPGQIERLLGRLPLITSVLMVSPHGWFAQEGVLGKPDTGGQVTYVLDQARALEQQMLRLLSDSGVDAMPRVLILTRLIPNAEGTTCNVFREKVHGTENGWIVRAPFRHPNGDIVQDWISRFHIWPYLEEFSEESTQLVVTELMGRPDLIIGHYTDGNLVSHRLGEELGVTHCACVHALEKTKYLLSDMHWSDMENDYHFSLQFTADLIAYNSADFILSSSYREVGGTATEMGMIESYELFSMPGLYRATSGLDPRLARHNIVPPGASEEHFFPNTAMERRVEAVTASMRQRFLESSPPPNCVGRLKDASLPLIFSMARLDKIKNLTGLVEIFGKSPVLRDQANLLLMTSVIDPAQSKDQEEIEEAKKIYELLDQYNLDGHVRWCAARLDKGETGEMYRVVADGRGVFAQPAYLETFGLTVIEAMACGLPVVVTCFGGPSEIVEPGRSGLVENPNDHASFAQALSRVLSDRADWDNFSEEGIRRVEEHFTWGSHANKVLRMANVHAYCNHVEVMNRQALDQYIHTLYHTVYRPRAQAML